MNPSFDQRSFTIDTFNVQLMQTDPRDFTRNAVNLANQLAQQKRLLAGEAQKNALATVLDPFGVPIADRTGYGRDVLPHQYTYASVYNTYKEFYYYYFDEALRNNLQNMLAMRRDGLIQEILRHRQLPTVSLNYHLVPDDPDDKAQQDVAKQVTKVVDKTASYQSLKLWLLEWIFFGKSGVKTKWDQKKIDGVDRWRIGGFDPIQGDKIVYKWDGTPGVLVWAGGNWVQRPDVKPYIDYTTIGPTFFLYNKEYRKNFILGKFEASDFDYLFESEKAGAVNGIGLRDRFYWTWNLMTELLSWQLDAMQRVGANGMLYAFFQAGNPQAQIDTLNALKMLVKENVSAFPLPPQGMGTAADIVQNIPPAPVGYDVMFQMMTYLADIIRRGFLGQNLSSQSEPTGLGSGMSELHADMFQNIILYDAKCLEEVLDDQQLQPIVERNIWTYKGQKLKGDQLPFGLAYKLQVDRENVQEMIDAAEKLHNMGVLLDAEDLRDKAGLSAPKNSSTALAMPGGVTGTATNQQAIAANTTPSPMGASGPGRPRLPMPQRGRPQGIAQMGGRRPPVGGNGTPQANGKAPHGAAPPARYARAVNGDGASLIPVTSETLVRITYTPKVRQGVSLFAVRTEWAIGDDPGPAILLVPTEGGDGLNLYTYDESTRDYVVHRSYGADERNDAVLDATALAQWMARAGAWSETVPVADLASFQHQDYHGLSREAYDVRAKVVGSDDPPIDCWTELLKMVDRSSEASWDILPDEYAKDRSEDPGVMIALMLPPDVADALRPLADPDVADEFHVTLAYLGRLSTLGDDVAADAMDAVRMIAEAYAPLEGVIKGCDRFVASDSSDGRDVLYARVDVPGLGEFRAELREMMDVARIPYSKNHTRYVPHVTLSYVEPGTRATIAQAKLNGRAVPVTFGSLALVIGGRVHAFPFGDGLNVRPHEYATAS